MLSTFNYAVRGSYFDVDQSYELHPMIIKSWKWNSKDNTYILSLNPDFKFHDGTSPNSKDLEFSLLRGFFSEKQSFYEIYLGSIDGVDKVSAKSEYMSGIISGVKIIDDLTISVKLKNPNPSFLFSLTRPYFSLTSKRFYKSDFLTWKDKPTGTGKYKFENENDEKIVLSAYLSSLKKFKKIELFKKNIKGVEFDISYLADKIKDQSKFIVSDPIGITTIFFNQESDLSKDINFRNALYYGIDRKKLVKYFENARESYEYLPSKFWSNNSTHDEHDLEKAKEFSNKISATLKNKVWNVPVYSTSPQLTNLMQGMANELTSQLLKIGIKVKFYASSYKFLPQEIAKESAFSIATRVCDNLDPLLMFGSFRTNSAFKYDNAQNDAIYDKLYTEAASASGTEARVSTMRKLSKYALDKRFFIPLVEKKNVYYYNPKTVKSLGNQVSPTTLDFDQIEMK